MLLRFLFPPFRPGLAWRSEDCRQLVTEVQTLLSGYEIYHGPVHGVFDAATGEAVSKFQANQGLKPTGRFDPTTYCRLLSAASVVALEPAHTRRPTLVYRRVNVLITKSLRRLTLYDNSIPIRQYPIAIGKPSTPTPEGDFAVATKILNPGGVLGTRWMGLNYDAYGIHGTNAPWKIGQMVSNGCIRMHNANAEDLFQFVSLGTPVLIRN